MQSPAGKRRECEVGPTVENQRQGPDRHREHGQWPEQEEDDTSRCLQGTRQGYSFKINLFNNKP